MDHPPAPAKPPVVMLPAAGAVLQAFGETVTFKLGADQTGGGLSLWMEQTPPGVGPPPHYHLNEDELFIVVEGRVEFFVGGEWKEPGPGAVVFIPRGNIHTFRNAGAETSRMWVLTTPSGFETFFARCADEFAQNARPDMSRIVALGAEHGIHFALEGK